MTIMMMMMMMMTLIIDFFIVYKFAIDKIPLQLLVFYMESIKRFIQLLYIYKCLLYRKDTWYTVCLLIKPNFNEERINIYDGGGSGVGGGGGGDITGTTSV
jgi:hypothetical protein